MQTLEELVKANRKSFFTERLLRDAFSNHEYDKVKTILPMYNKNPKYLITAVLISSPEIVQLLLDNGFKVNEFMIINLYYEAAKIKNLLLLLQHWNPRMTLTDFLIKYKLLRFVRFELEKYPITLFNNDSLRYALYAEDIHLMKKILEIGDIDRYDIKIILTALGYKDISFLKLLLDAKFVVEHDNQILRSELVIKLLEGPFEIFLLFIGRINFKTKIIYYGKLVTPIEYVVRCNTLEWLDALVSTEIDPNQVEAEDTLDPLILIAANLAKFDMVEYLLPDTLYINRIDSQGYNLITYVIWHQNEHVDLLQQLIDRRVDLNAIVTLPYDDTVIRVTPLLFTAIRCKISSMEILLKAGCDINFTLDNYNVFTLSGELFAEKILQLGFSATWESDMFYTAGIWAATHNSCRDVQLACIKYLPDQINQFGDITFITATSDVIVTKELLNSDADVNLGANAFDFAFTNNHPTDKLLILLEKGVRPTPGIIEELEFRDIIFEAVVFWNLSVEERMKYPIRKIAELCPLYREELTLINIRDRSPVLSILPNELLSQIARYMETDNF